jgi:hypothetical protein
MGGIMHEPELKHSQAGATMVGPDSGVYFVPERIQPAFPVPVVPDVMPDLGGASASMKTRKRVQENQAYLPQMPVGPC